MKVYRLATRQEVQDFVNYGIPKILMSQPMVLIEKCKHDQYASHAYHEGELRDGPCDPEDCGSSIHWFDCDGAGLDGPDV